MRRILVILVIGIGLFMLGLFNREEICAEYTDGLCECVTYQGYPFQAVVWPFDSRVDVLHNVMFTIANIAIAFVTSLVLWFITKKIIATYTKN